MKKRFLILISIITISLIVSVSAFLIAKNASNSPPVTGPITCKTLQENPGSINIVFFATEEQAKRYIDYFLSIAPFDKNKEKFSFYLITPDQYKPDCEIYQGIAILCQSSALTKVAAACPNDYILVLNEKSSSIRSSAFKGVMSLNTNHPLTVFAHEFGHVAANFAEEYLTEGASIPNGGNCQKKCSDFNKFPGEFGCSQECTDSNHYREFENGFMRSLSAPRYGPYDELLMQEAIEKQFRKGTITGNAISTTSSCEDQEYYLIEETSQGFKTTLKQGCPSGRPGFGSSYYQITDPAGNILSEKNLDSNTLFTTDSNSDGQITAAPQMIDNSVSFTIPANEKNQDETLTVYDDKNNVVYQTSLTGIGSRPCKT